MALKFLGNYPDIAEQIRTRTSVEDVQQLLSTHQVDEVLYLKFKQHEELGNMLLDTHPAELVYTVTNDPYWGQDSAGQGANELGKALVRLRDRLRIEGYRSDTQ